MGTLTSLSILDGDALSFTTRTKYKNSIANSFKEGIVFGSLNLPPNVIKMDVFETKTSDEIKNIYPSWNGYYVDGLLLNSFKNLDKIPDAGVLKVVGIFDPTAPIAKVITQLEDFFVSIESSIGIPVVDVLVQKIDVVVQKSSLITDSIKFKDTEKFFEGVKEIVKSAFSSAGRETTEILKKIEDKKESIKSLAENIIDESLLSIKDVVVPDLPLPNLDTSFLKLSVNPAPLFATIESNNIADGIATKFIKIMTLFIQFPIKIIQEVQDAILSATEAASKAINDVVTAVKTLLTDVAEGVRLLFSSIFDIIWSKIRESIGIDNNALLEIVSLFNIVIFFVKAFIVSFVGFLLGSGLITLAIAKSLEIS